MSIAATAEPFHADAIPDPRDGQRVGVLLVQGFTGSPASVAPWGRHLADRGLGVTAPLLPGHGTTWRELNRSRWPDWYGEVERSLDKLRANHDQVVVGGLSMGGALALRLAADRGRDVAGVVGVNPALSTDRVDVLALPVLQHVVPSLPGVANDIKKAGVEEFDPGPGLVAGPDRAHACEQLPRGYARPRRPDRLRGVSPVHPTSDRTVTSR